jgi:hypothetical protein
MELMVIPLPRPLTTPPVTTMYFMAGKALHTSDLNKTAAVEELCVLRD